MNDHRPGTDRTHPVVHAFVISWSGRAKSARDIAAAVEDHVDRLTVIHSEPGGALQHGPGDWVNVSDTHFYGMKFRRSLDLFDGDVMLQIQADAECGDWPGLVDAARECFTADESVGVWAPDVSFTPLPLRLTSLVEEPSGRHHVAIVDGIVWALAAPVCDRLRDFGYADNNTGWGIDWAAACHAHSTGRSVLVDPRISVTHPMSRGYRTESAQHQMDLFLDALHPRERAMRELICSQLSPKRSDHPLREGLRLGCRDLRHRARLAVDGALGRTTIGPTVAVPAPVLTEDAGEESTARRAGGNRA